MKLNRMQLKVNNYNENNKTNPQNEPASKKLSPNNLALEVSNLGKCYHIYGSPQDQLKQIFLGRRKKYYKEFWALDNINFSINKGEAFGVIGRNGAGKSTLLQLISGTLTPTTGKILTFGRIASLLELGAGFNLELTGEQNIYLSGALMGLSRRETKNHYDEILAFADIGDFIKQPVKTYSSGMFMRLAFATHTCIEPEILIIDEALSVGDIYFRQKCYQRFRDLNKNGTCIILVSHDMNQISELCQRALVLKDGKTIFCGEKNESITRFYLSQQIAKQIPVATNTTAQKEKANLTSKKYIEENNIDHYLSLDNASFINLEQCVQISKGGARCLKAGIFNKNYLPCNIFQQGEIAHFFFQFELLCDIEAPFAGVCLYNEKGTLVHGKTSLEHGTSIPIFLPSGSLINVEQHVNLELSVGEYTFDVGLGCMSKTTYQQRHLYDCLGLYSKTVSLCNVSKGSLLLTVIPRQNCEPVQLLHHGIANLTGHCVIQATIEENAII